MHFHSYALVECSKRKVLKSFFKKTSNICNTFKFNFYVSYKIRCDMTNVRYQIRITGAKIFQTQKKSRTITRSAYSCIFLTSCNDHCSVCLVYCTNELLTAYCVHVFSYHVWLNWWQCTIHSWNGWKASMVIKIVDVTTSYIYPFLRERYRNFWMKRFKFFLDTILPGVNGLNSILIQRVYKR